MHKCIPSTNNALRHEHENNSFQIKLSHIILVRKKREAKTNNNERQKYKAKQTLRQEKKKKKKNVLLTNRLTKGSTIYFTLYLF